ncbi:MAG: M23 family metallopeptidase [Rhizomicrobium sp.]
MVVAIFPERQIYIRSDGRVQFFRFGPALQALAAGLALLFLLWVAFATTEVLFGDRELAAKDHRYHQMQASYQAKLSGLEYSYNGLNGALLGAETRFKATADRLEIKQKAIANLLNRKTEVETAIAPDATGTVGLVGKSDAGMDATLALPEGAQSIGGDTVEEGSTLPVMPDPARPQPRGSERAGLLERTIAQFKRLTSYFSPARVVPAPSAGAQHPGLDVLARHTRRLAAMGDRDTLLMKRSYDMLAGDIDRLRDLVHRTGLNANQLQRRLDGNEDAMGGPEILLDPGTLTDAAFNASYLRASAILNRLEGLTLELRHLPLSLPVESGAVDLSSGFGFRLDPFTRRYAFHPGMDFAGAWGTPVHATAAGTVIFAGPRGSYGNMVEIDHGMGLQTRYGHLSRISVRVGMRVEKGATIGRLGSTGRSTGPHVHYEVWYDDVVRNPRNFIEAGRHVL